MAGMKRAIAALGQDVRQGLVDSFPVLFAFLPLGLSFGMYAVALGLDWYWAPITALFVFAGSLEFLAVPMLLTGAPLPAVATTTLFVNARHVFYGLSVPLERIRPLPLRLYSIHALTDESYAVLGSKNPDELTPTRMLTVQISTHFYWTTSVMVGALAATAIHFDLSFMGFAMTALFVVLALEALKRSREFGLAAAALVVAVIVAMVASEAMLVASMLIYLVIALAVVLVRRRSLS